MIHQTNSDFEIIVVDNGSSDGTPDFVLNLDDPRISLITQEKSGRSLVRNTGLNRAKGEFIALLAVDDTFLPHKKAVQTKALDSNPDIGVITAGLNKIDENGNIFETVPAKKKFSLEIHDWLIDCQFHFSSSLIRKEWIDKIGGFDPATEANEDWDYCLKLANLGCHMHWQDEIVLNYRIYSGNTITSYYSKFANSSPILIDKFFSNPGAIHKSILARKDYYYANAYLIRAFLAINLNDRNLLQQHLKKVFQLYPCWGQSEFAEFADKLVAAAFSQPENKRNEFLLEVVKGMPAMIKHKGLSYKSLRARLRLKTALEAFESGDRNRFCADFRESFLMILHG